MIESSVLIEETEEQPHADGLHPENYKQQPDWWQKQLTHHPDDLQGETEPIIYAFTNTHTADVLYNKGLLNGDPIKVVQGEHTWRNCNFHIKSFKKPSQNTTYVW